MCKKNVRRLLEDRHLVCRQITAGEEKISFVFGTRRHTLSCNPMNLGDWGKTNNNNGMSPATLLYSVNMKEKQKRVFRILSFQMPARVN